MSIHEAWCRWLFESLNEGGKWAVPRSGLVFYKRGSKLVLEETMPHEPGMPLSPHELNRYQAADYAAIKAEFESAGIAVEGG